MVIMNPGAFPDTYFPDRYWTANYWAKYAFKGVLRGSPAITSRTAGPAIGERTAEPTVS